jgi:hypothetical protein
LRENHLAATLHEEGRNQTKQSIRQKSESESEIRNQQQEAKRFRERQAAFWFNGSVWLVSLMRANILPHCGD